MGLLLCHGFMKNINFTLILSCPSRMLEYYFLKGFVILESNSNKLFIISNEAKQRVHIMDMHNSDYVMTFNTAIISISKTLQKFWIQSYFHSYYIQTIYNIKEENINNVFSKYFELLLDDINHTALVKEWKLNIDAAA